MTLQTKPILVTCCAKNKSRGNQPMRAIDQYISTRIVAIYNRARKENRKMLILSGLFGLIAPDTPILWYDKLLTPQDVGGMVDIIEHHLRLFDVKSIEYITEDIRENGKLKPYQDLLAAACMRYNIPMTTTLYPGKQNE